MKRIEMHEMAKSHRNMSDKLRRFSLQRGADLFGVADLRPAREFIATWCPSWVQRFPLAVSIGMRLNDEILDTHSPDEPKRDSLLWHHVYNVVTRYLDFLAYDVSRQLTAWGFRACPVPCSTPYDYDKLAGVFSHKLAAHLSGLGWIGKNCLLVTKEFGPRVRFASVLTNAPLTADEPVDRSCGKCRACVEACPVKAFLGVEFNPVEDRAARFEAFKCSEFRTDHPCGLCVSVCPSGKKKVHRVQ